MKKITSYECKAILTAAAAATALLITGCAGISPATEKVAPAAGAKLQGSVFGGRQPVTNATITLYAASNPSQTYGGTNTNLLTSSVKTDGAGNFSITGLYTCTPGQQMYIVALGGNPGAGTNPQAGFMAALGDCANLNSSSFIYMNEVTTVGSVFALAPFMTSYTGLGSPSSNTAGLAHAFASVNKLVNTATGQQYGPALPANAVAPSSEIATLANVLASCVNSTGGVAGDGSSCGTLFSLATPSGGTAPTNTIDAALLIAQNPANNAAAIFARMPSANPYAPSLTSAPTDWTMSIVYKPTGLTAPKSTTVDANGQVWIADSSANKVTVLSQAGNVASTLSGNGLSTPVAVAMDPAGNAWVANNGGNTVSAFTSSGGTFGLSPFPVGTQPSSLAFDRSGQLFVANTGSNTVSVLSSTGTHVTDVSTGVSAPSAVVVNPK